MIKLIGKNNCNACTMTKTILTNKDIDFDYYILEELSQEEQTKYTLMAVEQGMLSMPLIIENDKLKTLQEIINN